MKSVYRVLAYVVAALVAFQSAVVVFAIFGLFSYVEGGGVLDASSQQNTSFTGDIGFMLHGIGGTLVIPLVGLLLLISSFFAKIPGGIKWALIVAAAIIVQIAMGLFAFGAPVLGLLHGLNAMVLFGVAVTAAMRVRRATAAAPASPATADSADASVAR